MADRKRALHAELRHVLGCYLPGGAAQVFAHAGERAQFVAVHERAHRDLVLNTAYGGLILAFSAQAQAIGSPADEAQAVVERLINQAWHSFEGHASWMELAAVAAMQGAAAAHRYLGQLPRDYQAAVAAVAQPALLDSGLGYWLSSAMVCALCEYALDRRTLPMAWRAASLRELGCAMAAAQTGPDADLAAAWACVPHLAGDRQGPDFSAARWAPWLAPEPGQGEALQLLTFRQAVAELKQSMARVDPGWPGERPPAEAFGIDGGRALWQRLRPDAAAIGDEADSLFNDGVRFGHADSAAIDLVPQALEPAQVLQALVPAAASPRHLVAFGHEAPGVLLNQFDGIFGGQAQRIRDDALQRLIAADGLRLRGGDPVGRVSLLEVAVGEAGAMRSVSHLVCWPHAAEFKALRQGIAAQFGERWLHVGEALHMGGRLWWHDEIAPCGDHGFVALGEHGTRSFRQAVAQAGAPDFHWCFGVGPHAHAVCFGRAAGPTFFSIGPGGPDGAARFTPVLGMAPGTPTVIDAHLHRLRAAVAVWSETVPYAVPAVPP
jgi:hypothetical protein